MAPASRRPETLARLSRDSDNLALTAGRRSGIVETMTKVWQIAAGDEGRGYSALFIAHDLMFLGPGYLGEFDRDIYKKAAADGWIKDSAVGMIERFSQRVETGDVVLLRQAQRVVAIGLVHADGYRHDSTFDDVHGWDLEHTHRVLWQDELVEDLARLQTEAALFSHLMQMPTFTRVHDPSVLDLLQPLISRCTSRDPRPRPSALPPPLTLEEVRQALTACGLITADRVVEAITRQRRLLAWYREFGDRSSRPNEHEVVAYMIVPLLLALGWPEERLAIEWQQIDVAGFTGTPNGSSNCVLVCEAKRLQHGLQTVWAQPARYVQQHGLTACRSILVSQGARFYLFERPMNAPWPESPAPTGYINIEQIRTAHLMPPGADAIATLMKLTPPAILTGAS